jgi:hypothetical protein
MHDILMWSGPFYEILPNPDDDFRVWTRTPNGEITPWSHPLPSGRSLLFPTDLAISRNGESVAVADSLNGRLVIFDRRGFVEKTVEGLKSPEQVVGSGKGGWIILQNGTLIPQRVPLRSPVLIEVDEQGRAVARTSLHPDRRIPESKYREAKDIVSELGYKPGLLSAWSLFQGHGSSTTVVTPIGRDIGGAEFDTSGGLGPLGYRVLERGLPGTALGFRYIGKSTYSVERPEDVFEVVAGAYAERSRSYVFLHYDALGDAWTPKIIVWQCAGLTSVISRIVRTFRTPERVSCKPKNQAIAARLYPEFEQRLLDYYRWSEAGRLVLQWETSFRALRKFLASYAPRVSPTDFGVLLTPAPRRSEDSHVYFPPIPKSKQDALRLEYGIPDRVFGTAAYWQGKVYFGAGLWHRNVYALSAETGKEIWKFDAGWAVVAPIAINDKGWLAAVNGEGEVFILDAETGEWLGHTKLDTGTIFAPVWEGNRLNIKDANEKVHAFDVVPAKTSPNTKASAQSGKK